MIKYTNDHIEDLRKRGYNELANRIELEMKDLEKNPFFVNVKNPPVKKDEEINFSTGSKFDEAGFKFPDKVSVKDPLIIGDLTGDYSQYLAEVIVKAIKEQLLINEVFLRVDVSLEHLGCDSLDFLELFMVIENKLHESFHIEITDEMTEMFRKDVPIEEFVCEFTKYFHKLNPKRKK